MKDRTELLRLRNTLATEGLIGPRRAATNLKDRGKGHIHAVRFPLVTRGALCRAPRRPCNRSLVQPDRQGRI